MVFNSPYSIYTVRKQCLSGSIRFATRTDGNRYRTMVTELMIEGTDFSPGTVNQINAMKLTGYEFRLSKSRLDLADHEIDSPQLESYFLDCW